MSSELKWQTLVDALCKGEAYLDNDLKPHWGTRPAPAATDTVSKDGTDGLVTVGHQYWHDQTQEWLPAGFPDPYRKDGFLVRELVTRSQAEAIIRDLETKILDAAISDRLDDAGAPLSWQERAEIAEGIISDLKREVSDLRNSFFGEKEARIVDNAEKEREIAEMRDTFRQMISNWRGRAEKAEDELAAERAEKFKWMEATAIEAGRVGRLKDELEALVHDLIRIKDHETELVNDNAAKDARIKELEADRDHQSKLSNKLNRSHAALEAKLAAAEKALEPFANAADGRKSKSVTGSVCFSQHYLLAARAALGGKPLC